MNILSGWPIFSGYVSFRECRSRRWICPLLYWNSLMSPAKHLHTETWTPNGLTQIATLTWGDQDLLIGDKKKHQISPTSVGYKTKGHPKVALRPHWCSFELPTNWPTNHLWVENFGGLEPSTDTYVIWSDLIASTAVELIFEKWDNEKWEKMEESCYVSSLTWHEPNVKRKQPQDSLFRLEWRGDRFMSDQWVGSVHPPCMLPVDYMCWGLNSNCFHIMVRDGHQPNGLCLSTHYKDFPIEGYLIYDFFKPYPNKKV